MSYGTLVPPVSERDHRIGPADAPITVVEYGDFECPFCGRAHPIVSSVRSRLGKRIQFVFRHFPMGEVHPHARRAAEAAEAAGAQGAFWQMHDVLFTHQHALTDADLIRYAVELGLDQDLFEVDLAAGAAAERVREDFMSGARSGVNGTPTFFVNGRRYDGPWEPERLFLDALTREADRAEAKTRS